MKILLTDSVSGLIHLSTMTLCVESGKDRPVFLTSTGGNRWNETFRKLKVEFGDSFNCLNSLYFSKLGESNLDEYVSMAVVSGVFESLIPSGQKVAQLMPDTPEFLARELHKAFEEDAEELKRFAGFVNIFRELVVSPEELRDSRRDLLSTELVQMLLWEK